MSTSKSMQVQNDLSTMLCTRQNHQSRPIQILCLEDSCSGNRFGCSYCTGDSKAHRMHNIAYLNDKLLLSPLDALKIYANHENAQQLKQQYAQLYKKLQEREYKMFFNIYNSIRNYFFNVYLEFQAIQHIFDKQLYNEMVFNFQNISNQDIEKYVKMTNFLNRFLPSVDGLTGLKQRAQVTYDRQCNLLDQIQNKFDNLICDLKSTNKTQSFLQQKINTSSLNNKKSTKLDLNLNKENKETHQQSLAQKPCCNLEQKKINQRIQNIEQQKIQQEHNKKCISNPHKNLQKLNTLYHASELTLKQQFFNRESLDNLLKKSPYVKNIKIIGAKNFQEETVNSIIKFIPSIQTINCSNDWHYNYPNCFIDDYFSSPEPGICIDISVCQKFQLLRKLQNIWLKDCDSQRSTKVINGIPLKSIVLGGQKFSQVHPLLIKELTLRENIQSITLQKVNVKSQLLCDFISKNPYLLTICLLNCTDINDNTIKAIEKTCKSIKILFLKGINLKGIHIWSLKSLQCLILRNCNDIYQKEALSIKQLQNLQYLEISFNLTVKNTCWMNDKILVEINNLRRLKSLNICSGGSNYSSTAFRLFNKMRELHTFSCQNVPIRQKSLINFLEKMPLLKILALGKLDINENDIKEILCTVPKLTHLNLRHYPNQKIVACNFIFKAIDSLGHLQVLSCNQKMLNPDQQQKLINKGIKINFTSS